MHGPFEAAYNEWLSTRPLRRATGAVKDFFGNVRDAFKSTYAKPEPASSPWPVPSRYKPTEIPQGQRKYVPEPSTSREPDVRNIRRYYADEAPVTGSPKPQVVETGTPHARPVEPVRVTRVPSSSVLAGHGIEPRVMREAAVGEGKRLSRRSVAGSLLGGGTAAALLSLDGLNTLIPSSNGHTAKSLEMAAENAKRNRVANQQAMVDAGTQYARSQADAAKELAQE